MATHSSILAWRIPWTENLAGYSPKGHKESDMTEATEQASDTKGSEKSQRKELLNFDYSSTCQLIGPQNPFPTPPLKF